MATSRSARASWRASTGNIDEALELAEQAVAIATRAAQADLQAFALTNLGKLKIATGSTNDGMALMEEASISAVNGDLSPFASGATCCTMIAACRDLTDYRRASEWTEATEKYCERQSVSAFPGVCRIHRAEVVALSGAWDRAEQELRQAADELSGWSAMPPLADGHYAIGEIRRLKGDFEGAEAALREADSIGKSPQPALALIRLAQGKVKAAATAIASALSDASWDQWAKVRLLPAQVEIAIAGGRAGAGPHGGRGAGPDRRHLQVAGPRGRHAPGHGPRAPGRGRRGRSGSGSPPRDPSLARGRGPVRGRQGPGTPRQGASRDGRRRVGRFRAPGRSRRVRAARREAGRGGRGARPAGRRGASIGPGPGAQDVHVHRHRGLDEIRRAPRQRRSGSGSSAGTTTSSASSSPSTAERSSTRPATGSSSPSTRPARGSSALDRSSARSPSTARAVASPSSVRIGLHSAEANRRGADYSGVGVHLASRVAAVAGGGEIVATTDTLDEAGESARSDRARGLAEGRLGAGRPSNRWPGRRADDADGRERACRSPGRPGDARRRRSADRRLLRRATRIPRIPAQRVAFGTSGHRGSSFATSFNEAHIVAASAGVGAIPAGQGDQRAAVHRPRHPRAVGAGVQDRARGPRGRRGRRPGRSRATDSRRRPRCRTRS